MQTSSRKGCEIVGVCDNLVSTARKSLILNGEMSEWLKEHAWKACVGETLPWVRIPLSPPPSLAGAHSVSVRVRLSLRAPRVRLVPLATSPTLLRSERYVSPASP